MLHMFLYFQLNQGIGSVTQCGHLMVRNDGIEGLGLEKGAFSLLFLTCLNGTSDFVLEFNIFFCYASVKWNMKNHCFPNIQVVALLF